MQVIQEEMSWTFWLLDSLRVTRGWYAAEAIYKGCFEFFWVGVIFAIDEYLEARVSAVTGRADELGFVCEIEHPPALIGSHHCFRASRAGQLRKNI